LKQSSFVKNKVQEVTENVGKKIQFNIDDDYDNDNKNDNNNDKKEKDVFASPKKTNMKSGFYPISFNSPEKSSFKKMDKSAIIVEAEELPVLEVLDEEKDIKRHIRNLKI